MRLYQLIVFSIAGGFAGLAGGLFGIFNRGVFPDFCYWPKSAEVLIMTILGGIHSFWGPSVGAAILILLNQYIVSYTEYWPFVLGTILLVLLFGFPGGVVGAIIDAVPAPAVGRERPAMMLSCRNLRKTLLGLRRHQRCEPGRREGPHHRRSSARTAPASRRSSI